MPLSDQHLILLALTFLYSILDDFPNSTEPPVHRFYYHFTTANFLIYFFPLYPISTTWLIIRATLSCTSPIPLLLSTFLVLEQNHSTAWIQFFIIATLAYVQVSMTGAKRETTLTASLQDHIPRVGTNAAQQSILSLKFRFARGLFHIFSPFFTPLSTSSFPASINDHISLHWEHWSKEQEPSILTIPHQPSYQNLYPYTLPSGSY